MSPLLLKALPLIFLGICVVSAFIFINFQNEIVTFFRRLSEKRMRQKFLTTHKDKLFINASEWNARIWPDTRFFTYDPKTFEMTVAKFCRELFAGNFTRETEFVGYVAPNMNVELIKNFWKEINKRLNLKDADCVQVFETNYDGYLLFKIPHFWSANAMTRGFFTMFVRCGANHFKGDFEKALKDYHLTLGILNAVNYFLEGYTRPANNGVCIGGVYSEFHNDKPAAFKEKMLKRA